MVQAAPRLDPRIVAALERLERSYSSIAEIRRALGVQARALGLAPPSYEHVRRLVRARQAEREAAGPGVTAVAVDVAFRARSPRALFDMLTEKS